MGKKNTKDEITEINWDCYDGTDDSVITIDGVSVNSTSQQSQGRKARQRRELRQQLEREQIDNADAGPSFFGKIFKSFFRQA